MAVSSIIALWKPRSLLLNPLNRSRRESTHVLARVRQSRTKNGKGGFSRLGVETGSTPFAVAQLMAFDRTSDYSARSVAIASTRVARCAGR